MLVVLSIFGLWLVGARAQTTCAPVRFSSYPGESYSYSASFTVPPGCHSSQFNVSRLFTEDSTQDCDAFFSNANSSSVVHNPPSGTFDSGSVCGKRTFTNFYVQTTCYFPLTNINFITLSRSLDTCGNASLLPAHALAYHHYRSSPHYSEGEVIAMIVGLILCFVILLGFLVFICYLARRKHKKAQEALAAGMQLPLELEQMYEPLASPQGTHARPASSPTLREEV